MKFDPYLQNDFLKNTIYCKKIFAWHLLIFLQV